MRAAQGEGPPRSETVTDIFEAAPDRVALSTRRRRLTRAALVGGACLLVALGSLICVERDWALSIASSTGSRPLLRMLLRIGADPNAQDPYARWTALHTAAAYGRAGVAEVLLDRGADVNARERCANTPLHLAARNGHLATARVLVDRGADTDAMEADSLSTALVLACDAGHWDIAKLLVERGADVNMTGILGSPLSYAESARNEAGSDEVAKLLRRRGAKMIPCDGRPHPETWPSSRPERGWFH